jgi:hypothetical protein
VSKRIVPVFPAEYAPLATRMLRQTDAAVRERIWSFINLHDSKPEYAELPALDIVRMAVASAAQAIHDELMATMKIEQDTRKALGLPDPTRT